MTDTSLVTFKSILNFVNEISSVYGKQHKPLKLYQHLLKKTTLSHTNAIEKHVEAFQKFCIANRDMIINNNYDNLSNNKIEYSSKVYIEMDKLFNLAEEDEKDIIHKHLLTLSALTDPTGKAREILQKEKENTGNGESDFLNNVISKIENNVDPNSNNPMDAISSIMSSGVFSELVEGMGSGLKDGSLDMGKMMGSVQKMVSGMNGNTTSNSSGEEDSEMMNTMMSHLNENIENMKNRDPSEPPDIMGMMKPMMESLQKSMPQDENAPDIMGMIGPMMENMQNSLENVDENNPPDIASMLGPMMSGLMTQPLNNMNTQPTNSIEQNIESQLQAAKDSGQFEIQEIQESNLDQID